jgi:ABC-type transporter Mla subunit MlaD
MADEPMSLTVRVLKQIRDEVRRTNERLDATNERLEQMHAGLAQRIVESEVRTATAIAELAVTVRDMTSVLRAQNDLRPRVDQCERDIAELKGRLSA